MVEATHLKVSHVLFVCLQGSLSQASGPMFSPQATAVMGVLSPAVLAVLATVR
jgi:membrane associated rhomboid family serine protease